MIRTNEEKLTKSGAHSWNYLVLDEGHLIKNHNCQISKILRSMPADHRILLSGTPVQNNLGELWTLFDFITKGELFGTSKDFKELYERDIVRVFSSCTFLMPFAFCLLLFFCSTFSFHFMTLPITNQASDRNASLEEKAMGELRGEQLRNMIKPFLLRREKKEIFPSHGLFLEDRTTLSMFNLKPQLTKINK